jgi:hypothetical protein
LNGNLIFLSPSKITNKQQSAHTRSSIQCRYGRLCRGKNGGCKFEHPKNSVPELLQDESEHNSFSTFLKPPIGNHLCPEDGTCCENGCRFKHEKQDGPMRRIVVLI